jgi:hypothetical protein
MLGNILARLNEPSTHAALSGICAALSMIFPQYAPILQGAAVVFGGAGVLKTEKK